MPWRDDRECMTASDAASASSVQELLLLVLRVKSTGRMMERSSQTDSLVWEPSIYKLTNTHLTVSFSRTTWASQYHKCKSQAILDFKFLMKQEMMVCQWH